MPDSQEDVPGESVAPVGEPAKIEALATTSEELPAPVVANVEEATEDPATPVKLELPVKLLRLDAASVQIAQYEQELSDVGLPQRSLSLPDPWTSPLADAWGSPWGPWLAEFPPVDSYYGALDVEPHGQMLDVEQQAMLEAEQLVGADPDLPPGLGVPHGANPAGELSQGSAAHAMGQCRPCAWFWKPGSCQNADSCSYCHLCPEGELKARKKAKVAMMRLGIVTPKAKSEREANANVLRLSPLL